MTITALVNQYQKQVTVSKLKRFYTSVKQVETQVKADFGELNYVTNSFYPNGDLVVIDKFFKPYLKISKVCNKDCVYSYLDASSVSHDMSDKNGFYTSDGVLVLISEYHIGYEWDSSTTWGTYMIDINGTVAPNKEGRDVFLLIIRLITQIEEEIPRRCCYHPYIAVMTVILLRKTDVLPK